MTPDQPEVHTTADEHAADLAWLDDMRQRLGRSLRVLHIGNIANNAFNNARIQRQHGIEADVLSADNYHIMATPEWEEAHFDAAPADAFFPDWSSVNLNGYQRPRWFAAAPLQHACRYLEVRTTGTALEAERLWHRMEHERHVRCSKNSAARLGLFRRKIGWKFRHELQKLINHLGILKDRHERAATAIGARSMADLVALWQSRHGKTPFPARATDLDRYWQQYQSIHRLLGHYDIVQGYALDGIWALLAGKPYAAYEHGTLRQLPFEDSPVGRIAALVYGLADQVFVTNIDCLASADRLGLEASRVTPLPHAFDDARLQQFRKINAGLKPARSPLSLFMPARQDWRDADPNLAKGNDMFFHAAARLVQEGTDIAITAVNWGRDLEASKALIAELGLAPHITWVEPMQKADLWRAYLAHNAVMDQFRLQAFGGVTFEALALGRRVITALDLATAHRFFGEAPPLLAANNMESIAAALRHVASDPDDAAMMGDNAATWIARYHAARRVTALQVQAYRKMLDDTSHPV
jgi:glycosyltransferase involved in cell wall biosynthesis